MIGFIGLGIMGGNMANNLLKNGEELVVYNRTKEKAEPLLAKGAKWADSPKAVGEQADIVFTMLTNPEAVEAVALGENGLLEGLQAGKLWVDVSTVKPAFTKKMAKSAADHSIRFVDAPVAGSKGPAEQGQLNFLVGGSDADIDEIQTYLDVMGKSTQRMGAVGNGTSAKLVVNLLLVQSMASFSEALNFGEALALDREQLIDVLLQLPVTSPIQEGKRQAFLTRDFDPQFPLEHAYKDLQQIAETAYENGAPLPVTNAAKELYAFAKQNGYSKQDFAAVYELFKQD